MVNASDKMTCLRWRWRRKRHTDHRRRRGKQSVAPAASLVSGLHNNNRSTVRYRHHENITLCPRKNDTGVACYNSITHQLILVLAGRDVAETVSYRMVICYPTSPKWYLCTTWEMLKCKNCIFLRMQYSCIARLRPVAGLIYSVLLITTHAVAAVWLPKYIGVKLCTILGPLPRKKGRSMFCTVTVGLCWMR